MLHMALVVKEPTISLPWKYNLWDLMCWYCVYEFISSNV